MTGSMLRRLLLAVALVAALAGCDRFDRSFGENGVVALPFGPATLNPVAASRDGIIVLTGDGTDIGVVRYDADGRVDTHFGGGDGFAPVQGIEYPYVMTGLPGGGFAVAGGRPCCPNGANSGLNLLRFSADGELIGNSITDANLPPRDLAAAADGRFAVVSDIGLGAAILSPNGDVTHLVQVAGDRVRLGAAAFAPDGGLIVAGWTADPGDSILLSRIGIDGRVDDTFGWHGVMAIDDSNVGMEIVADLTVAADGRITLLANGSYEGRSQPLVARLLPNGHRDPTFGGDGTVLGTGTFDWAYATKLLLRPDGRSVVIGDAARGESRFALAMQWLPDGRPDASWGDDGTDLTDIGDSPWLGGAALLADGRTLAAGSIGSYGRFYNDYQGILVRYNAP